MRKKPARHKVVAKGKAFMRGSGSSKPKNAGKEYEAKVLKGKSSFIDSMTHTGSGTLVVKFKDGKQYLSTGVPKELFNQVENHSKRSGSMGKAFHKFLRGKFPGKKLK
jgi:hypothetical protein